MAMTIAVDFDGVIHKYSKGWLDGTIYDESVEGAKEALLNLMEEYAVYIHTTRDVQEVAEWMNYNLFPEHTVSHELVIADIGPTQSVWDNQELILVSNRKLPAIVYIDDRAVHFTDWSKTLRVIKHYRTEGHLPEMFDTIYCDYAHNE